jgi:hypothetical protein
MPRWTTMWESVLMDDEACHTYDTALCLMPFCVQVLEPTWHVASVCVYECCSCIAHLKHHYNQ